MAYRRAGPVIGSTIVPYQSLSVPAPVAGIPDLPSAFPTTLDSPLAWTGSQFATTKSYIHVLSAHELQEIQDALESFKGESSPGLTDQRDEEADDQSSTRLGWRSC